MAVTEFDIGVVLSKAAELPSVQRAFDFLTRPPITHYQYHNEAHTRDVMHEAALFALHDKLSSEELTTLLIAAAWHDVGFCKAAVDHERHGMLLFREYVANEKPPEVSVPMAETIEQMILDTKVQVMPLGAGAQQFANTFLSKYLLDADLSNLGRTDFFDCFDRVKQELSRSDFDFHVATLGLLSRHRWHTSIAESLRLQQEMKNAQELVQRIFLIQQIS